MLWFISGFVGSLHDITLKEVRQPMGAETLLVAFANRAGHLHQSTTIFRAGKTRHPFPPLLISLLAAATAAISRSEMAAASSSCRVSPQFLHARGQTGRSEASCVAAQVATFSQHRDGRRSIVLAARSSVPRGVRSNGSTTRPLVVTVSASIGGLGAFAAPKRRALPKTLHF